MDLYDEYEEEDVDDYDSYLDSLTEDEYEGEVLWLEAIALAIKQKKNVVPNPARSYDFMM